MSNNIPEKRYDIGDYVDLDAHSIEVKVVHQVASQGLQLKDPYTGQIDVSIASSRRRSNHSRASSFLEQRPRSEKVDQFLPLLKSQNLISLKIKRYDLPELDQRISQKSHRRPVGLDSQRANPTAKRQALFSYLGANMYSIA
jgi:hypothetical protein